MSPAHSNEQKAARMGGVIGPPEIPNSKRKLFFGLFVFPLIIAVGMALMLCLAVLMTHEKETPENLIAAIKKTSPSKRWQKAFELSNELNRSTGGIRKKGVINEIIQILGDEGYDVKTRGYMALALSHFDDPEAVSALREALKNADDELRVFILWSLGFLRSKEAAPDVLPYLSSESADVRKTAAYVLGAIGAESGRPGLTLLLNDVVADVQWNAALALARLKDASGADVLLSMLRREELSGRFQMNEQQIESVMTNAAKGLALIREPEAIKILRSVSRSDKNMKIREAAFEALNFQLGKTT